MRADTAPEFRKVSSSATGVLSGTGLVSDTKTNRPVHQRSRVPVINQPLIRGRQEVPDLLRYLTSHSYPIAIAPRVFQNRDIAAGYGLTPIENFKDIG